MNQVRKNMLYELLRKADSSERYRHELYEFIAKEPITIDNEVVDWLLNWGMLSIGVGKVLRPSLDTSRIHRPRLSGWSFGRLKAYLKEWLIFLASKVVCNALRKVLVFQPENQVFLVHSGPQGPGQRIGQQ
jgi:hypothetical protein